MKVPVFLFAFFSALVASVSVHASTITFTSKAEMCEAAKVQCTSGNTKPSTAQKKPPAKTAAKPIVDPMPGRVITVAANGDLQSIGKTTPGTDVFLVDGPQRAAVLETRVVDLRTQSFDKNVSPPAHTPPQAQQVRGAGGCIHTSDGTLLLKGQTIPVPKGNKVGTISDAELAASNDKEIVALLKKHPNAFLTDEGHKAMCTDWRRLNAARIQEQKGFQFNDDTHRVKG
jgi:hypothetical protein